ncbi:WD40/YVTN/BNR-like repeat-containing protein [Pyxidicoccus sp. 3LG]
MLPLALLVLGAAGSVGCGDDEDVPPGPDGGADAGSPDGGSPDAGGPDGGPSCVTCTDPEVCGEPAQTAACPLAADGRLCSADCWCWEYPLPHGYTLKGAHFRAPDDGWAVGELGHIQHWDGTRWTRIASGTTADLKGIHAVSATEVWAVGAKGTVVRSTGGAFSPVASGTQSDLSSVWAPGSGDLWAVGAGGVVLRNRGPGFSLETSGTTQTLNDVWGSGPSDVWLVGEKGTLLHHDGTALSAIPSGTDLPLYEVTGSGPGDVWSVTSEDPCLFCDDYGIVYRVSTAGLEQRLRSSDQFFHVFAASPTAVLVTGEDNFRWTGTAWQDLPVGVSGVMAGAGADDVWVFGVAGAVSRWNGSAWVNQLPVRDESMLDVHGSGPTDVWAVESDQVLHWDGSTWTRSAAPGAGPLAHFRGVYAAASDAAWAVTSESSRARIHRWSGTAWSEEYAEDTLGLQAVHGSSRTDVWAVGANGAAVHRDGTGWTRVSTGSTQTLTDVWTHGPSLAVAVGNGGTVLHWNGTAWTAMASGTRQALNSVWGSGPSDIWAAGAGGTLLHFDGTSWSTACSGTGAALDAVWGTSATDVWAAGSGGTLLRLRNGKWVPQRSGARHGYRGLWAASATELWLVGDSAILHKR